MANPNPNPNPNPTPNQGGNIAKFQGHYYYGGDLCMVYQREGEVS